MLAKFWEAHEAPFSLSILPQCSNEKPTRGQMRQLKIFLHLLGEPNKSGRACTVTAMDCVSRGLGLVSSLGSKQVVRALCHSFIHVK